MRIRELIAELQMFNPELEIMILDSFNGGGNPREINLGPVEHSVSEEDILNSADMEEMNPGTCVIVMGYGCY